MHIYIYGLTYIVHLHERSDISLLYKEKERERDIYTYTHTHAHIRTHKHTQILASIGQVTNTARFDEDMRTRTHTHDADTCWHISSKSKRHTDL